MGLIPGIGDALANIAGSAILVIEVQLNVSKIIVIRMGLNLATNALIGAIPVFGDIFSIWFRSNAKNADQLLSELSSLDVGADRIARTAYTALAILGKLRTELGIPIPLAWTPTDVLPVAAIEVYPAATLVAHQIRSTGYKKRDQTVERREIVEALRAKLTIGESVPDLAPKWGFSRCGGLRVSGR